MFVTLLFGYVARDIDCAFKLFRREVLDHVYVESRGAAFSAELLIKARDRGFRIKELPVTHLPREAGRADRRPAGRDRPRLQGDDRLLGQVADPAAGLLGLVPSSLRRAAAARAAGRARPGARAGAALPRPQDRADLLLRRLRLPRAHPRGDARDPAARQPRSSICTYPGGRDLPRPRRPARRPARPGRTGCGSAARTTGSTSTPSSAPARRSPGLRFRPDVVHAHLHEGALIGWLIARALRRAR